MFFCASEEGPISFLGSERERLDNIVEKNEFDLQKDEVQKASQRMDQVILYWYRKKHGKALSKEIR